MRSQKFLQKEQVWGIWPDESWGISLSVLWLRFQSCIDCKIHTIEESWRKTLLRETDQDQMLVRCLRVWKLKNKHLLKILWKSSESTRAVKNRFYLPLTKNTTNWEWKLRSSSVQIFHALTWRRKTATAATEWRFPRPARVRRGGGRGSEAFPHRQRWK